MQADPANEDRPEQAGLGARIAKFRKDKGLNLSQLADQSGVSKSYLSTLENSDASTQAVRRPSAKTLYAIAQALGVTMADLLGRRVLAQPDGPPPPSLMDFAEDKQLPAADVQMLSTIKFRGEPPRTAQRWQHIYNAIRLSEPMDDDG
ncbi:helix-turn-helix transcriptional regulator [Mycobacterium sp. Aquia_216]|uniref:helix-turn-helix domain-containing protein n=1 Tax=Mycobacterium sp. Aquia_216 TaxID=2991729 RepID=UPI00227BE54D|nr:helix-turn-helix transcriptional regulator [Mycobacterium sp. Aquia_216]WAJ42859.1 helix-turn-helix transcriptional regulator [Mycobacterium sp. Aquia_216]